MISREILKKFRKCVSIPPELLPPLKGVVYLSGLPGTSRAVFLASYLEKVHVPVIYVVKSNRDLQELLGDLSYFVENDRVFQFPSNETLPYDFSAPLREYVSERVVTLSALVEGKRGIYIVPVRGFIDLFIEKEVFKSGILKIRKGEEYGYDSLIKSLIRIGYERVDRVEEQGTFSVRGDIIDVFSPGREFALRFEFFDNTVESIRDFSHITQKSKDELDEVRILPAVESFESSEDFKILERGNCETLSASKSGDYREDKSKSLRYASFFTKTPDNFLGYVPSEAVFIFDSYELCERQAKFFLAEAVRQYSELVKNNEVPPPEMVVADFDNFKQSIKGWISIETLPPSGNTHIRFNISEKKGYNGNIEKFKKDIENFLRNGYTVIVGAGYDGQTNRLREILNNFINRYDNLYVVTFDIKEGFISDEMKLAVILDREIFNRKRRYKKKFLEVQSQPLGTTLDVKDGDYIVHVEHGIGIYRGVHKLKTGEVEKDFIKIEYRDGDEIFVPVDQINLLQKYIGHEGRTPRIDKIGTDTWKKIKEHVKKSVKKLAKELLELYAIRATLKGHAFSKDTPWQHEFESGFRFEETPDQLRTIEEIKRDMESPKPMDRLVCGDVGFGKTEVAIRAAFKAVMDGKQVAVLVPTTVLAEQHLNTFRERFSLYPINVEMLSRFKSPKEQKIIIQNLANGLIDVVIGTHRLLQKDVKFKDLGLVIIDEEQRFGVEHKEHFKKLRKQVDVITMTATPIPRTLYMSMTKIRDMSIIETPPHDRVPIETYVMEENEEVIVQAIRREVDRGGQVYYVHNRIKTIHEKAEQLRKLLPDVSIEVAHGRMDEKELEEVMQAFYNMEFQVLVSTTIIESGLDIPNVNTIIIERADRFGLSQLYQLRGRVGRSRRKAYAYLLYPKGKEMNENAERRLAVINDYTHLGAGFSIAMKDLEIRGAGNILGREQHGDMLAVGFEMYVKLLDEAIRELKEGPEYEREIEPHIDLEYRGYIPESYIESERLRIEMYKRMAQLRNHDELLDLKEEMRDRFGPLPPEVYELFNILKLKLLCKDVGVKAIHSRDGYLQLTFEKSKVDIISLIQKIAKDRKLFRISPEDYNNLIINRSFNDNVEMYDFLRELFDYEETRRI